MKYADRIKETTTVTSTSTITLGGAATGYRTFSSGLSVGDTGIPVCVSDASGNWEISTYTLTSSNTLTRENILSSSNGGQSVTFSAGSKEVFCTLPAGVLVSSIADPSDPGFDIILLAGQSNMVGQDAVVTNLDITDPNVFVFNAYPYEASTYQKITLATDPLRHNYSQTTGVPAQWSGSGMGPGIWFGRTYAGSMPRNRKVLLVPVARSATHLVTNNPGWGPGDGTSASGAILYENAIAQGNAALNAAKQIYPNSRIVGTLWLQGENDAQYNATQASYAVGLKALIQGFRNRLTGASKSWFIIVGMCGDFATDSTNFPGYYNVDLAHRQVAAEMPYCAYVQGVVGASYLISGYPVVANNPHYSAAGIRLMATQAAAKVPFALNYRGVDATIPTITKAVVPSTAATTVMVTVSEPLDPAYAPQTGAWTVSGHTVTGASIVSGGSNNTIALTVTPTFVSGEAARTVTFTATGNNVRDLAGNQMQTQSPVSITNNAPAVDSTPPSYTASTASIASGTPTDITFTMNETLANSVPDVSAFAVTENGSAKTLSTVLVSGTTVTLRATTAFSGGNTVAFTYTQPGANPRLQDATGNATATFGPVSVTNNAPAIDTTPPTVSGTPVVANATPTSVQVTMSETLAASTPPNSAFTITENGSSKTIAGVSVSGNTVTVTVSSAFTSGTSILLSYTQPGTNPRLQDAAGNATISFGPSAVTNNVAVVDTTPPAVSGTPVIANAAPTDIVITMNETLAASIPPTSAFAVTENGSAKALASVSVSGTTVTVKASAAFVNGSTVQITYTQPGANPRLQDAASNLTTNFGPLAVTNNVAASAGTDLQFTDLQLMTDTSSGAPSNPVPPYSYKMNSAVNYSATPQGATSSKALAGDGTFTVKIATVAARQFIGLKSGATTVAYGSLTVLFMAETTGYKMYYPDANTTAYVTGRVPAENDMVRMTRSGTNITYAVSSDSGATWTDIAKQANVTGTKYLQILGQGNGQFIAPQGVGFA